jgi:hypothetical protein
MRGAPSGWDVVFDAGQGLFYQRKSLIAGKQFGAIGTAAYVIGQVADSFGAISKD